MKFSTLAKKLKVTQKKLNQFLNEQFDIEQTFNGSSEIDSRTQLVIETVFPRWNSAIIKCVEIRGLFSLNKSHLFVCFTIEIFGFDIGFPHFITCAKNNHITWKEFIFFNLKISKKRIYLY